ncbi:MAG: hypothetical protein LAT84_06095 [Balneolia bacterium]|nr:hypothetical protein [Balneolia bacterium]
MKNFLKLLLPVLFFACSAEQETGYFNQNAERTAAIEIESVEYESIYLEYVQTSLGGVVVVNNDMLNFIDYRLGKVHEFDTEGNYTGLVLDQGRGPSELPRSGITFYSQMPNGGYVFVGSSYDYYVFNSDYDRLQDMMVRFQQDKPLEYLNNNPTPEDHRSYNLAYYIGDLRTTDRTAFLPLLGGEPQYTAFNFTTDLFAEEARILASMDIETGEVDRIFGRLSPVYVYEPNTRMFPFFFYDLIDDETMAITYGPDPDIYLFSTDFDHIATFGVPGRNMEVEYESFEGISDRQFENFMLDQWDTKDFYRSLQYVPETNLLFRGYTRRSDPDMDGLQIYRDNVLIADVDIPSERKVIGYIDGWYYTDAEINEREETKKIYRFRLD